MKTNEPILKELTKNDLKQLTEVVIETVASDYPSTFTSLDLWKIRKMRRVVGTRRTYEM